MSGLQARTDGGNGRAVELDVREQGNTLRVATNTPHLVSLGTGRLSTAVTLHPIKQGRVTVGSDPTCDMYVVGSGVAAVHCRVENSHGVVTLYPIAGTTLLDSVPVDKPTRLSQGSMLTIGRSNYLRFNHPAEALLMKSVLPTARREPAASYVNVTHTDPNQCYQPKYNDLSQVDQELDNSLRELTKKPTKDDDRKPTSIMSKVSKFEYYAKQNKIGRSQFYTSNESEISPKVFSSNSLTVNTPAKDVLGGKLPNYMNKIKDQKVIIHENNSIDPKSCSYANVAIRNNTKIEDIVKNFDEKLPKKVNNEDNNVYGKINNTHDAKSSSRNDRYHESSKNNLELTRNHEIINEMSRSYQDTSFEISKINHESRMRDFRNNHKDLEFSRQKNVQELRSPVSKDLENTRNLVSRDQEHTRNQVFKDQEYSRNQVSIDQELGNGPEGSKTQDRNVESSRSLNGIGVPLAFDKAQQYLPVYANQYDRSKEAETMRKRAYQERVKEEEKKEAEMERLEEILDIFTEYQKQLSTDYRPGVPITPTEKRPHNKIITNGSLPRSVAFNNPNFVKTSDGYYKFDTNQSHVDQLSQSLPTRNVSSYENFNPQLTPEVTIPYDNLGRMDEIGIPVFDDPTYEVRNQNFNTKSPNFDPKITKTLEHTSPESTSSPYENVYVNRTVYNSLKPKSPNTSSPRTRIKTTFAHKTPTSPQYFVFPDRKPELDISKTEKYSKIASPQGTENIQTNDPKKDEITIHKEEKVGIEKQLSLEEDIPMIDDNDLTNDIEIRYSKVIDKNQSFEDVKKELMADIPELEAFEKDLELNKKKHKEKVENNKNDLLNDVKNDYSVFDDNIDDLKRKYDVLKEERRKLVAEIHEVKCKMTEITSQEDDILRELEMEKALIKGEYDSEIAILKIEQRKRTELSDKVRQIEEEIKQVRERQQSRQNEMRTRVDIATMKVERLERDHKNNSAALEELQNAQDILDNESKIYEDLEFQHLEEESELLSNREDIQNEITLLTKKIDAQKNRILTLKSEANNNLTSALDETKVLHNEYVKHLNNVEYLTAQVQTIESELKPIVAKLNEIERAQSPDSAFYTDQTRTKSGEFGYSPQSSDSDDIDTKISNFETHTQELKDKFNSIDQMSQSMTVDVEKRIEDSPKSKKGFWERNFDSLKRKKKPKSPEKVDIMSQSLNENIFFNNEVIEDNFERFGSLRNSKKKEKNGPVKSNSSSKIPTIAALGKIMKKDSFKKDGTKNTKHNQNKSKSLSPDKENDIIEEDNFDAKLHRKSCGDEPNNINVNNICDSGRIPSQDDIDRISKVTIDAPLLSSETDLNAMGKRTLDSLMEVERKRFEMLEEQGCQVIENEREKISELKRRAQDETKKLWDQKYREKSVDSDFNSLNEDRRSSASDKFDRTSDTTDRTDKFDRTSDTFDRTEKLNKTSDKIDRNSDNFDRSEIDREFERSINEQIGRAVAFDRHDKKENERSVKFERSVNFDRSVTDMFDQERSVDFDRTTIEFNRSDRFDHSMEDSSLIEDGYIANSTIYEESSGLASSSIEELQVRNSRTESTEDEKRSDDSRPLSHASDFSRDNILSLSNAPRRSRRGLAYSESQRPLTRYLPQDRDDFDLRRHVESAGHQVELCPHVSVTAGACRGYLHKLGAKFNTWSKRWFVFDRDTKTFVYYWDKSEKKPRGGAYFQVIEEVYLDHGNTSKSPSPATTFIVKTRQRRYHLMAPSGEAARVWIDAIFTGAQGYTEYQE